MPVTVELYRTQERANAEAKRAAARTGAGAALGVRRLTPSSLVEELWEVWGDGRELVGALPRSVLVRRELEGEAAIQTSSGAASMLASFFRTYASRLAAGGEDWEAGVTEQERAVLALGRRYLLAVERYGLVEPDEAAALLAQKAASGESPGLSVTLKDPLAPTPGVAALVGALDPAAGAAIAAREPEGLPRLPDGVEPAFLVAAGTSAVASLVLDELEAALADGAASALVCGPNAPRLFEGLSPHLAARGAACALRDEVPVSATEAGRLVRAMVSLGEGRHIVASAADVTGNLLAGFTDTQARHLNRDFRQNRLLKAADVAGRLGELSPLCACLREALSSLATGSFKGVEEAAWGLSAAIQESPRLSVADSRREMTAAIRLREVADAVRAFGGTPELAVELWLAGSVRREVRSAAAEGRPLVEFASPARLSSLVAASYDLVVLSDMSDGSFRARAGASSLDELAEKLGWAQPASAFDEQRRLFADALGAARRRFSCVVPQRTDEGDEAYPAFVLGEYREALAAAGVEAAGVSCGEDDLVRSVGVAFSPVAERCTFPAVERGRLERLRLTDFLRRVREEDRTLLVLSPSAIERYLGCPYAWFIQNRIAPQPIDERFGPLEEGQFVHGVFARFYEELAARRRKRVGEVPWDQDEAVLREVFRSEVERQKAEAPGSGRLVAVSSAEGLRLLRLYRTLRDSLRRQARFAPSFSVKAHERVIGPEDGIDYAGVRLNGRVDRIDVDADGGRFAVIDYKGAAAAEYGLGATKSGEVALPKRVQALVYAQALCSQLEALHCAGALYLGYRARQDKELVAGAVDGTAFDDTTFIKDSFVSPLSFDALLDFVEEAIAQELSGLEENDIAQRPRYAAVCSYCPVPDCQRRLS